MKTLYFFLMTAFVSACVGGNLADHKCSDPNSSVFLQTEKLQGAEITICGHLRYEFENANLFPTENWKRDWADHACVPVGIRKEDESLIQLARSLSGKRVKLVGRIEKLVDENTICTKTVIT